MNLRTKILCVLAFLAIVVGLNVVAEMRTEKAFPGYRAPWRR